MSVLTCIEIYFVLMAAALGFWWFVSGLIVEPIDMDDYEAMLRRCAKADGVDFDPQDVRPAQRSPE